MSARRCRASVSTVAVQAGQPVKTGDVLLSIEAMKMETALRAARDGIVQEVLAKVGRAVDAKDLLITLKLNFNTAFEKAL